MDETKKAMLVEAANRLKAGYFVGIRGYVNAYGEKSDVVVHADANYVHTHINSILMLEKFVASFETIEITYNAWVDANGVKHNRKANGRTLTLGIKETVQPNDPDFLEAIEKLRKGIVDPKKVTDNYEKIATSVFDNGNETYFRNVLIHSKNVLEEGDYPVTCSLRVNVIAEEIRKNLPIGGYRCYVLKDDNFTAINLMAEKVESSSSSEE